MRKGWIITAVARTLFAALLASGLCVAAARAQDGSQTTAPALQPHAPSEDDLRCLTLAIAYEAGNQSVAGQEAVAEVVLNRTHHPAFPASICGVVFQGWTRHTGCQFTFACDGAIDRRLSARALAEARAVAERVAGGAAATRVAGALNYHANYVSPVWANRLDRVAQIGAHIFYRPQPGGVPESGRAPRLGDVGTDSEGQRAIRLYAGYFSSVSAAPARSDADHADSARALGERAEASRQPFLPWGLALR
jgi:hypothetical protein